MQVRVHNKAQCPDGEEYLAPTPAKFWKCGQNKMVNNTG